MSDVRLLKLISTCRYTLTLSLATRALMFIAPLLNLIVTRVMLFGIALKADRSHLQDEVRPVSSVHHNEPGHVPL